MFDVRAGLPDVTGDMRDTAPGVTGLMDTPDGSEGMFLAVLVGGGGCAGGGLCLPTGG